MDLSGKRIALLIENDFRDEEVFEPKQALEAAGARVLVVGPKAGETYKGKLNGELKADISAEAAASREWDAIVIPGGYAPDKMRLNEHMVGLVRRLFDEGKPVAAICHAGWMLCEADVLRGKRATSYIAIRTDMKNAGCDWVDEECVVDGNLITSRHPGDLPAFNQALIAMLAQVPARA